MEKQEPNQFYNVIKTEVLRYDFSFEEIDNIETDNYTEIQSNPAGQSIFVHYNRKGLFSEVNMWK